MSHPRSLLASPPLDPPTDEMEARSDGRTRRRTYRLLNSSAVLAAETADLLRATQLRIEQSRRLLPPAAQE